MVFRTLELLNDFNLKTIQWYFFKGEVTRALAWKIYNVIKFCIHGGGGGILGALKFSNEPYFHYDVLIYLNGPVDKWHKKNMKWYQDKSFPIYV